MLESLYPFQSEGVEFLKDLRGGIMNWSTGAGKTLAAIALTKHHLDQGTDYIVWVVKAHNRANTARAIRRWLDIEATIVGDQDRPAQYEALGHASKITNGIIIVTNYEKLRDDKQHWIELLEDTSCFIVFDEMPAKLKSRGTQLYQAVKDILYIDAPKLGNERPSKLFQVMLSATPIENSPEDLYNCVRLLDPTIFGSVKDFRHRYVARYNRWREPAAWKNLDDMAERVAPIVHRVDKKDPEIAAQFPPVDDQTIYLEMESSQLDLYRRAEEFVKRFESDDVFAVIGCLNMIANNPRMALLSASQRSEWLQAIDALPEAQWPPQKGSQVAYEFVSHMIKDDCGWDDVLDLFFVGGVKWKVLRELLDGNDGKAIVFTTYNELLLPLLSAHMADWGYDHVLYHGKLSASQKQAAEDRFVSDPDCRVFLSTDAGSDSLNLEVANLVVNYNLPWTWARVTQRVNRAHRITSTHELVRFFTLVTVGTVEDRLLELLATKIEYDLKVLKTETEFVSHLSASDYRYILTGD